VVKKLHGPGRFSFKGCARKFYHIHDATVDFGRGILFEELVQIDEIELLENTFNGELRFQVTKTKGQIEGNLVLKVGIQMHGKNFRRVKIGDVADLCRRPVDVRPGIGTILFVLPVHQVDIGGIDTFDFKWQANAPDGLAQVDRKFFHVHRFGLVLEDRNVYRIERNLINEQFLAGKKGIEVQSLYI